MGWRFDLRYANIVSYLTHPAVTEPPRLTKFQLREFFGGITGEYRDQPPLISSDPSWVQVIVHTAEYESRKLSPFGSYDDENRFLDPRNVAEVLASLRNSLGGYELYAIPVGTQADSGPLNAFATHMAYSSLHSALILIPDYPSPYDTIEIFDPTPPIRALAERQENWPGVLFWLPTGESTFAPLRDAERLYYQFCDLFDRRVTSLASAINEYNNSHAGVHHTRLLHLSDPHFGKADALRNEPYLMTHLQGILGSFDRVVITGDLFDNPNQEDYRAFYRFRIALRNLTGKDPVLVPGNHDQRRFGNSFRRIGTEFAQLADLEWGKVVVDDEIGCVFLCFNSSEGGDWARGRISNDQLRDVATEYESQKLINRVSDDYRKIAVTHHHPYPSMTQGEQPIQRALWRLGGGQERFTRMENAEQFLNWCASRNISLIMHGHKHVPRHASQWINPKNAQAREVTAVGCGASLGVGRKPLSYNLVSWIPDTERWSVNFFSDPGDGSGFGEDYMVLHTVAA